MRFSSWLIVGVLFVGCQGKPTPAPVASSTPVNNEPMPPEIVSLLESGNSEAALAKADAMIKQRPNDTTPYAVRSSIHHHRGYYAAALADLDHAISLNDHDPRLLNNRGFVKMNLQMVDGAKADFDRATQLSPEYANPYNNRGLLLIAQSQFASALEEFDTALNLDPNYVDAYNNRGFAALQANNIERALADFNMALLLNPKYVNAYNNRGLLRARLGDLDNAVIDFTQAMMLEPMNPKYYEHRREVYLKRGAIDLALADENRHDWLLRLQELNAQIFADPSNVTLLVERSRHYMQVDDQERALKDLDRALNEAAECIPALMEQGRVFLARRQYTDALSNATGILQISASQEALSLAGDACMGLQNYDKAIEYFSQARRIDPIVAEAYYRKSQILQTAGQMDEAIDVLQQAIALDPDVEERLR